MCTDDILNLRHVCVPCNICLSILLFFFSNTNILQVKKVDVPGVVSHTCNPSYSGDRDQEITV
jgi:hypothetical protein